jgi:hypothetical protein
MVRLFGATHTEKQESPDPLQTLWLNLCFLLVQMNSLAIVYEAKGRKKTYHEPLSCSHWLEKRRFCYMLL